MFEVLICTRYFSFIKLVIDTSESIFTLTLYNDVVNSIIYTCIYEYLSEIFPYIILNEFCLFPLFNEPGSMECHYFTLFCFFT